MAKSKRIPAGTAESGRPELVAAAIILGVCALGLLPFSDHMSQFASLDVMGVLVALAGVSAAGVFVWVGRFGVLRTRVAIAAGVLLGWLLVCGLASGRVWSSLMGEPSNGIGWLVLVALAGVGLAGAAVAKPLGRLLIWFSWLVVLLECVIAVSQVAQAAAIPRGTLPNSTYLGEVLLLLLPWTLVALDRVPTWERNLRFATAAIAPAVLIAAGSRVAGLVAFIWVLWCLPRAASDNRRVRIGLVVALVVLAGVAASFARTEIVSSFSAGALGVRPATVRLSVAAVKERPLLGYGPDGFLGAGAHAATPELAATVPLPTFEWNSADPHNALLWVVVSGGLVALGLFVWLCIELIRRWLAARRDGTAVSAAVWGVVGAFVVFLTAPAALQVLPLFALTLGVSLGMGAVSRTPVSPPVVAAATVAAALLFAPLGANSAVRFANENPSAATSPARAAAALRAARTWSWDPYLQYLASLHVGYALNAGDQTIASEADLIALERATSIDTRNPIYALERARTVRFYRAQRADVEAAFNDAFARYPVYPQARAEFATFLAENGDLAAARQQLAIAKGGSAPEWQPTEAIAAAQAAINAASK